MVNNNELYHYGVKGMKWGVRRYRNEDGSLTTAGRKRLAKDIRKNTDFTDTVKWNKGRVTRDSKRPSYEQKRIAEMPEIQELHKKLSSTRKEFYDSFEFARKFNTNDTLVSKYREKAAHKACKDFGITDPKRIQEVVRGYKYGDLDQGSNNSFALYCKDKKVDYNGYLSKTANAKKKYEQSCREYADGLLKEYGSKPVDKSIFRDNNETVSDVASRALVSIADNERYRRGLYIPT